MRLNFDDPPARGILSVEFVEAEYDANYVDAARPHFRKKIAKQEKEAAAIAANLAAGLTADGRAK